MKIRTWIVVCDGGFCKIFDHISPHQKLSLVDEFKGDRRPDREIISDRQGRTFEGIGAMRHGYESQSLHTPHESLKIKFVQEIIGYISQGEFDQLILISPPKILGYMREQVPDGLSKLLVAEIGKDLLQWTPQEIFQEVHPILFPQENRSQEYRE